MTYLRPYVNSVLKNHPHGDTFKEIRYHSHWVGSYIPPDPEEEEQTRAQEIFDVGVSIAIAAIFGGRSTRKLRNTSEEFEPLKQRLSELMDILDCSKDSIWLATYRVEEGASDCPYAVSVFEEYLKRCELNP